MEVGSIVANTCVSVIIPVHNGEKYIYKTVKKILSQSLNNIEIILVENFSVDSSLTICKKLAQADDRIIVAQSFERGTTFARKKGIELAKGEYVFFCDQDDSLVNQTALESMYQTIKKNQCQICQFSLYNTYRFGLKRFLKASNQSEMIDVQTIRKKEIGGLFGSNNYRIDNGVFTKIYSTDLLKDCLPFIKYELYTCEDTYLNLLCIHSDKLRNLYIDINGYYRHRIGRGITSTTAFGERLFEDYNVVKPLADRYMHEFRADFDCFYKMHLESLHFMLAHIVALYNKLSYEELLKRIDLYKEYDFIVLAKDFMNNCPSGIMYDELRFLASDYTAEEYYKYFKYRFDNSKRMSIKQLIKKMI